MLETAHLQSIFRAALRAADAYELTIRQVSLNGSCLSVAAGGEWHGFDLDSYSRVIVLGAGKASARMATALEVILGERISGGLISVKYGHGAPLKRIEVVEAGHPVPDAKGGGSRAADCATRSERRCADADP